MRYYETLYILNPDFEQEKTDIILNDIGENVSKFSEVIYHNEWGKKRLAYPINNHKYGTYVLLHFETETPSGLDDFESFMKLNNSVLRYQNVRLDSKPEIVEEDILDESSDIIKKESPENDDKEMVEDETKAQESEEKEEVKPETVEEETSA
jgi:small subunit ribosomal protein S6